MESPSTEIQEAVALESSELLSWYRKMVEIRLAEDKIMEIYMRGLVPGTVHLAQGQEGVAVGANAAIDLDDWFVCTYRGHHHSLARGIGLESFFAEVMGKAGGVCHGMGGTSYVVDASLGMLSQPAIIGAGIPLGTGAALSAKIRGEERICITFFGDGACNIGAFHEALNMAQLWKVPGVYVIENNQYGEYTPYRMASALSDDLAHRAEAYGMANQVVDGQDALAVYEAVREARSRALAGDGPTLIEAKTYRYRGHSRTDPGKYRPEGELEAWKLRDPIEILGSRLKAEGFLSEDLAASIKAEIQARIDAASDAAELSPWPTFEEAESYVFAE